MEESMAHIFRRLRLESGETLQTVSEHAHLSLGYLSEVERGVKMPSTGMISRLCKAHGVRLSTLVRDTADLMDSDEEEQ
jgi:transcriptional regulator with XRE-family HTH domain